MAKISIRQADCFIVSTHPDVLKTPVGDYVFNIPYNVVSFCNDAQRVSETVFDNKQKDYHLNSYNVNLLGHEAGTLKGVKSGAYKGTSKCCEGNDVNASNTYALVRHGDKADINIDGVPPEVAPRAKVMKILSAPDKPDPSLLETLESSLKSGIESAVEDAVFKLL